MKGSQPVQTVLFIGPVFYEYTRRLIAGLESQGLRVTFVPDRPFAAYDPAYSLLRRTWAAGFRAYCNFFLRKRLARLRGPFDRVFLLHGETFPPDLVANLRRRWPAARFVYYNWDSVASNPNALRLRPHFDAAFSFDPADCERYPGFRYQPMFFLPDFAPEPGVTPTTDLLFIGNAHSDRRAILTRLQAQAAREGWTLDACLLTSAWKVALWRHRGDPLVPFYITKPLNLAQVREKMARARALLDVHHPRQSGLTQRTYESLGMGLKLVTTNEWVRREPFFHAEAMAVIDRSNPEVNVGFLRTPAPPIDLSAYTLDHWIGAVVLNDAAS